MCIRGDYYETMITHIRVILYTVLSKELYSNWLCIRGDYYETMTTHIQAIFFF